MGSSGCRPTVTRPRGAGARAATVRMLASRLDRLDPLDRLAHDLADAGRVESSAGTRRDVYDIVAALDGCLAARGWTDRVITDAPPVLLATVDLYHLDAVIAALVGEALAAGAPAVRLRLRLDARGGADRPVLRIRSQPADGPRRFRVLRLPALAVA